MNPLFPSLLPPPPLLSFLHLPWVGKGPSRFWSLFPADSPTGRTEHPEEHGCVPGGQGLVVVAAPRFPPAPAEHHHRGRAAPCQGGQSGWQAECGVAAPFSHPHVSAYVQTQCPTLQILDLEMLCPAALAAPFQRSLRCHQQGHRPPSLLCPATLLACGC